MKPIDTSRTGKTFIKFGRKTKTDSFGTVTVLTPIGNIVFYVFNTRTPFLFYFKNINEFKIQLNNVNNVLIQ